MLDDLARKTRRRGIVILISDLFDDEEKLIRGIQHLRFVGHEVIVFHVLDPYEVTFPFQGTVEFHRPRSAGPDAHAPGGNPQKLPRGIRRIPRSHPPRLRALRLPRTSASTTDQPWAEVLTAYLATRQHRYG